MGGTAEISFTRGRRKEGAVLEGVDLDFEGVVEEEADEGEVGVERL